MAKVVGMMSMSLDGYVADADDGLTEVFDWYFSSGDIEVSTASATAGRTYRVPAPNADYLRCMMAEVGAVLIGRRTFEIADGWGGHHPLGPAFVVTHHVPEGQHNFFLGAGHVPEITAAVAEIGAWVRSRIGLTLATA
jgi:dihydrofolate reductase